MNDPILNNAGKFIPISIPTIGDREVDAVTQVVKSGWISQGQTVSLFESSFAQSHSRKYGAACNSGTTALHLSLAVLDIGEGDEVVIPGFTMIAVANSVLLTGAKPVFADSANDVGNISLQTIQNAITPRTKCVIVVHTYGEPIDDIVEIVDYCHNLGIRVIEDCAEAHFAIHKSGSPIGSFGDLAAFSFYANKNITTGEGGIVLSNDHYLDSRLKRLRMHAFTPGNHFKHQETAFGYRMTNMQAAIGLVQLDRHREFMQKRQEIRDRYECQLADLENIKIPKTTRQSAYWVMPIIAENNRDQLRKWLADAGIETRTFFYPMHKQAFLRQDGQYPIATHLGKHGFYLPIYPNLTLEDVDYICNRVKEYFNVQ